jgi:hypothetical protein
LADGSPVLPAVLLYLAFAAFTLVGPGIALQRLLRLRIDPALVLPIGFAFGAAASWASLALGLSWILPLLVLVGNVGLVWPRTAWRLAEGPRIRGAIPAFLVVGLVLAVTQYPMNRRTAEGDFLLDDLERVDTAFHVGVTWELATSYPPQVPGLAGVPLGYHVGPHLIRAAALRWAGTHPYDALYRFDVTLWALALVLALRAAAWALGAPALAVALAPWSLLATDFSFLLGLARPGVHWWTELLRGNLLLSVVFANSAVPALAMALGVVVALRRQQQGEGRGWLVSAAMLALAVPFFKIFLASQLLAGLAIALLASSFSRPALAFVAAPCLLATVALAIGQGGRTVSVFFDPLAPVALTREMAQLPPVSLSSLAAALTPWLLASLGLRLVGLPAAFAALRSRDAPSRILAVMALVGWPVALLLRITADGRFDESVYFTVQSGALLWLFTATSLARLAANGPRRVMVLAMAAAVTLPSTIELVWRKALTPPDVVPARVTRAMAALEKASAPGDVVLTRPFSRYPPPPIVFIGRRVAFTQYMPYLRQFAPAPVLREREELVRTFFRTADVAEARQIARRLGARFVYLFGPQRIATQVEADLLQPIYLEEGVRLYRVAEATLPPLRR